MPTTIKLLPKKLRPRELFDKVGPKHVGDEVLLAIILRSGTQGTNVVDLARALLLRYETLEQLAKASIEELSSFPGMGKVKAQVLKASLELARRLAGEKVQTGVHISEPHLAAKLLLPQVAYLEEEVFWLLLLDKKNRLMRMPLEISRGILDANLVHPREVFKEAIRSTASQVILAHNHPSGDPSPSAEDIQITKRLIEAGKIIDIKVLDHLIIGKISDECREGYRSMREFKYCDFE